MMYRDALLVQKNQILSLFYQTHSQEMGESKTLTERLIE